MAEAARPRRKAFTDGQRRIFAIAAGWKCAKCDAGDLHNTLGWDIDHVRPRLGLGVLGLGF